MGRIQFTLEKTLNELNMSPYRLSVISQVRSNTVTDMVNNQSSRINISTLELIITSLNKIAEERNLDRSYNIDDVFIYVE
ncbi:helix-turn-helix transcriptional regulator [Bacillus cereus group sp. BfR-BA-01324]|uniref:helix-turn-helix transcriptional regulator n=1 Tax=Bacillus cereus group sp. BfR-BA-01324 TaxID=2920300 RepID=UPI001F58174E|nr:helix-turn-helix transcriptional regulator [Bacillus cereus group sp. BfR-BA-01324]